MSHLSTAIGLVLAGLLLSGCSDTAAPTPEDSGPVPTQTTESTSSESPSEVPTETETTPAVAPASGPKIAVRGLRANAPKGWHATRPYAVMSAAGSIDAIGTKVYVFRFPNSGLLTLDGLARSSGKSGGWKFRLERLDDLELDGQPAFHVAGKSNPGEYVERYGAILNDDRLTLTFEFVHGEDKATRDEIIASVLATVQYG